MSSNPPRLRRPHMRRPLRRPRPRLRLRPRLQLRPPRRGGPRPRPRLRGGRAARSTWRPQPSALLLPPKLQNPQSLHPYRQPLHRPRHLPRTLRPSPPMQQQVRKYTPMLALRPRPHRRRLQPRRSARHTAARRRRRRPAPPRSGAGRSCFRPPRAHHTNLLLSSPCLFLNFALHLFFSSDLFVMFAAVLCATGVVAVPRLGDWPGARHWEGTRVF